MRVTQDLGDFQATFEWTGPATEPTGPQRIVIEPKPDADPEAVARGISTVTVRQMSVGQAVHDRQAMRKPPTKANTLPALSQVERKLHALAAERSIDTEYLAWLSAAYVSHVELGNRSVTKRLAEIAGKSPETIRVHLQAARAGDLLTSTPGRAGGTLTRKAHQALKPPRTRTSPTRSSDT